MTSLFSYLALDFGKITDIDTGGLAPISPATGVDFIMFKLIPFLISVALYILLALSVIFLIIGGIMWITSSGEKEGLAKAKATVTYALLGLTLGVGSFIILRILGDFFGFSLLGIPGTARVVGS